MTTFKIGEVAILQNCRDTRNNGVEVMVSSNLRVSPICVGPFGEVVENASGYSVNGLQNVTFAFTYQLRKKHPPRSAKSIMRAAILKAKQPSMVPA